MKQTVYVLESRKVNSTKFRAFENPWNFFCIFENEDDAIAYVKGTTMPGAVWYGYLEFRITAQEVY